MRGSALCALAASLGAAMVFAGCAARGFVVPTGSGTVEPTLAQAYQSSIASCGDLRSLTADIKLSGRVDGRRVRGTLQVGLTRDGGVRIEAVAPFGAPIFTIAGRADAGTLWLPRSREVVRAAPAEILEALTGVALPASGLFEIVTACPAADDAVVKGGALQQPGPRPRVAAQRRRGVVAAGRGAAAPARHAPRRSPRRIPRLCRRSAADGAARRDAPARRAPPAPICR